MLRPNYRTPDGARPDVVLRLIDVGLKQRPRFARLVRGVAGRLLWSKLPDLVAQYEEHSFFIPERDPMYASVFFDGAYERDCSRFLKHWLHAGDHAVDVGANHGWYSLLMASAVGERGSVLACEPMPDMVAAWKSNIARNPHLRATLVAKAVGESARVLRLHEFTGLPHGHTSASDLGRSDFTETQVAMTRLDDLVAGRPDPTFVKLDVEGSELAVLKGASDLLGGPRPPSWLVEVNYTTSGALGYSPANLYEHVVRFHPYEVYRIMPEGLAVESTLARAPHASSWLFVSQHDSDRVASHLSRHHCIAGCRL